MVYFLSMQRTASRQYSFAMTCLRADGTDAVAYFLERGVRPGGWSSMVACEIP